MITVYAYTPIHVNKENKGVVKMTEKGTPQVTLRLTSERQAKIENLRSLLNNRPGGERIHGALTTAQIIDWAMDCLIDETVKKETA
jgi:hypothetical protein